MSYRLPNDEAPAGSKEVELSRAAFKRWMAAMPYEAMSADNPGQECYFIHKQDGVVNGTKEILNCHLTAMLKHRDSGPCENFHFKIQMGKASSHYWHYKLYHSGSGKFFWGADRNKVTKTNQAGGGAGDDASKVHLNLLDVEKDCAKYNYNVAEVLNKGVMSRLLRKLEEMVTDGRAYMAGNVIN